MNKLNFNFKRFLLINVGLLILVLGLHYFLIPSDLAVGGIMGLAMVVNNIFPNIPIGIIMIISNIILFILAFAIVGKEFGGYTMYSSFMVSLLVYLFETISSMPYALVDDLFINLVFGILIQGLGMAIIFSQNTSTGGTDIIAKIINKFTHLDIGKSLFLADFLIVLSAMLIFGIKLGLYALLGILINSTIIDNVIAGFNTKVKLVIISEKSEIINKYITEEMERGVTLFYGVGGFSNSEKIIMNTIVSRREYIRLKNVIKEIDPKAFLWVSFVTEVLGEGFSI